MKKKKLTGLSLNKKTISKLEANHLIGGTAPPLTMACEYYKSNGSACKCK